MPCVSAADTGGTAFHAFALQTQVATTWESGATAPLPSHFLPTPFKKR
jgi:hypothetical protein